VERINYFQNNRKMTIVVERKRLLGEGRKE
jgi:hypothetical protein